jgi:hypothetical protein
MVVLIKIRNRKLIQGEPTPPFRHPSTGGDFLKSDFQIPSFGGVAAGRGGLLNFRSSFFRYPLPVSAVNGHGAFQDPVALGVGLGVEL